MARLRLTIELPQRLSCVIWWPRQTGKSALLREACLALARK
jgi:hypothetical protein